MYPLIALGRASSFASDSLTTGQEFGRRLFVIQSNENCHVRPFQSCYLVSSNSSAYSSELFLYAEQFFISSDCESRMKLDLGLMLWNFLPIWMECLPGVLPKRDFWNWKRYTGKSEKNRKRGSLMIVTPYLDTRFYACAVTSFCSWVSLICHGRTLDFKRSLELYLQMHNKTIIFLLLSKTQEWRVPCLWFSNRNF